MDEMKHLLIETSERAKSNTHRIDELAKEHAMIHELAISVKNCGEHPSHPAGTDPAGGKLKRPWLWPMHKASGQSVLI